MSESYAADQWVPSPSIENITAFVEACVQHAVSHPWGVTATTAAEEGGNASPADIERVLTAENISSPFREVTDKANDDVLLHRNDRHVEELHRRYATLVLLVEAMETNQDEFAAIDAEETGVPLCVTNMIASSYGPCARAFLQSGLKFLESRLQERIPGRYGSPIVRVCSALSPVVIIAPWNVPFGTILPKLFVAWLSGCAVLLKPSEYASRGICAMLRKLTNAKYPSAPSLNLLPPGAVQVLCGGPEMGAALTVHPNVRCVQFTGSSSTAFKVAAVCSKFLRPFHAECGGSNAAIITDTANIDLAVRCIAFGMTTLNGQWCMGLSRVFVHEDVRDEFLHKFVAYMNHHVRIVDPVDPSSFPEAPPASVTSGEEGGADWILVGRLAYELHAKRLQELCDRCNPSTVLFLGEMPPKYAASSPCYFQPRLLIDPDTSVISGEELFGPAAGLIRFRTIDEAIRLVNSSTGQLASYIFGGDTESLYRLAPRLHTGMVMINSVSFGFEVADGHAEPHVDFVGTAGHGADGNGAALAEFFTTSMWIGVNGPQQ